MSNERVDSAMAEKILRGDDTDPDILQSLGLELLAELKRCYEEIDTFHPLHGLEVWDEDPDYSRAEWREGVAEGHVTSGYWRWVSNHYLASK